jgi:hypothetical protein
VAGPANRGALPCPWLLLPAKAACWAHRRAPNTWTDTSDRSIDDGAAQLQGSCRVHGYPSPSCSYLQSNTDRLFVRVQRTAISRGIYWQVRERSMPTAEATMTMTTSPGLRPTNHATKKQSAYGRYVRMPVKLVRTTPRLLVAYSVFRRHW